MTRSESTNRRDTVTWAGGRNAPAVDGLPPRWRLERPLGRGGQAEVWLARDTELDQWVALKVFRGGLDDAWRERMRREVRIGRDLSHPGIVRVFELVEGEGSTAVAMEWVDGQTLAHRVAEGPLPMAEVIDLASQLLEVLAHLHQRSVIHRDLKPSNILLQDDGRVRLADLGLARPLEGAIDVTRTEQAVGTPAYMSPEQLRGEALSPASDLYGLGATLFHALTGVPPYEGESGFSVADGHLRAAIPNPRARRPDCPRWLARFIRRLLEKRPADRWPDAAAALAAFTSHRRLVSPRVWRRAAVITVGVAAVVWAGAAALDARRGPTHSAHASGDGIVVLDAAGKELWRQRFPGYKIWQSLVADLVGDGEPEVVVSLQGAGQLPEVRSKILVYSHGREMNSIEAGGDVMAWRYPRQLRSFNGASLALMDADGDGHGDLGWTVGNLYAFGGEAGVANLRRGEIGPVFTNSGHLHALAATDLDSDGAAELVAAGVNNVLGYQTAVAIVRPVPVTWHNVDNIPWSPDFVRLATQSATPGPRPPLAAYTLLGLIDGVPEIDSIGPDGIVVRTRSRSVRLDASGNPEGSPLWGKGPAARTVFWDGLVELCFDIEAGANDGRGPATSILDRYPAVLAEDPMHLAAVLMLARSLSRAGEGAAGAAILLAASVRHPDSADLWLKRATYQAAAGFPADALTSLDRAVAIGARTQRFVEALNHMVMLSAFAADRQHFDAAVDAWSAKEQAPSGSRHALFRATWAFFRGDWQDLNLDSGILTEAGLPELHVIVAWAELERSGDVAAAIARARELANRPDVREFAVVLEAGALARQGQFERAAALATQAHAELERLGREELNYGLWAPLADHVAANALSALGHDAEASALYSRAAATAPNCWFGQPPTIR
jgi:tetratricopeptide (TPR) repeat protein